MKGRTLSRRLIAASLVWILATVGAAGVLLVLLFEEHIERRFDRALGDHQAELVAAAEIVDGHLRLTWTPADPRLNRPHSGWYWQIMQDGKVVARSESLWRDSLRIPPPSGTGPRLVDVTGPAGEPLRALVERITLPESDTPFVFVVAGPTADIWDDVGRFGSKLALTLLLLALGLAGAVLVQVRFGLRPLRALRTALQKIRAGEAERLPETFPAEVEPVVEELNALLDHNAALVERARVQAGNLAHALRNPLTVIRNEARALPGETGEILREQASAMATHVERYLKRARAAGGGGRLAARAAVAEVAEDLAFSLGRLHADRRLDIGLEGLDGLVFRGDPEDLEEMLGNLMDNACKWARRRVRVRGRRTGQRLELAVEDDGAGIPEPERAAVVERGRRLDETRPGSGLGLAIVREIAELYRGDLRLEDSELGGVRAVLTLPAAD